MIFPPVLRCVAPFAGVTFKVGVRAPRKPGVTPRTTLGSVVLPPWAAVEGGTLLGAFGCCVNVWVRVGRGSWGRAVAVTKLAQVAIKGDAAPALGFSPPEPVDSLVSHTMGEHSTFIPRGDGHRQDAGLSHFGPCTPGESPGDHLAALEINDVRSQRWHVSLERALRGQI